MTDSTVMMGENGAAPLSAPPPPSLAIRPATTARSLK
jgi:hypothetical protein